MEKNMEVGDCRNSNCAILKVGHGQKYVMGWENRSRVMPPRDVT